MPTDLTPFAFGDNMVRVITDEHDNPWFVAKDVCRILEISNHNDAISHLDDDEKGVAFTDPLSSGGRQEMRTISESGLYALIFRSRKPEARTFSKWVRSEVLPAIRRTGHYEKPEGTTGSVEPGTLHTAMPDAVKRLRPQLRERVLADAIQTARLTSASTQEEIDAIFLRYCALVGDTPEVGQVRLPGMALGSETETENIRRFADQCLVPSRGNRVNATDLYACFRNWWRVQFDAAFPSIHKFGRVMQDVCAKMKRGGAIYYVNIDFKEACSSS